jgi:hypothetical protein
MTPLTFRALAVAVVFLSLAVWGVNGQGWLERQRVWGKRGQECQYTGGDDSGAHVDYRGRAQAHMSILGKRGLDWRTS